MAYNPQNEFERMDADEEEEIREEDIVIADMNVEGMPWYKEDAADRPKASGEQLQKGEMKYAVWGAVKAALLIAAIFSAAMIAFTLFCIYVWF